MTCHISANVYRTARTGLLCVLVFLSFFAFLTPASATTDYAAGTEVGDPILANCGQLMFDMTMLDLGGPLPLKLRLRSRTHQPSSEGLPWCGAFQHNLDPALQWQLGAGSPVVSVAMHNYEILGFSWNTTSNSWDLDPDTPSLYSVYETGSDHSNGWYYLTDSMRERVYVYEKNPAYSFPEFAKARLRYAMDRNGNTHTYQYSTFSMGQFYTNISDGLGRSLSFEYNGMTLTNVVDQGGRNIAFISDEEALDADSNTVLRAVVNAEGGTNTFRYTYTNYAAAVVSVQYPQGNMQTTQAFNDVSLNGSTNFRASSQSDAYGNTSLISYDPSSNIVTQIRPDGHIARYEHTEEHGTPVQYDDPDGETARFSGNSKKQWTGITDRLGDTMSISYAQHGGIQSFQDTDGGLYSNTYAAVLQVFTNPANGQTFTGQFFNLTRQVYPDGSHEDYSYDARGNRLTRDDRATNRWGYSYNDQGQVLSITNPLGGVVHYTYNPDGTRATATDSDTGTAYFRYDAYKRLTGVQHADGSLEGWALDACGHVLFHTNEVDDVSASSYDVNGNRIYEEQPDGGFVNHQYDLMDRRTNAVDAYGRLASQSYDVMGRLASVRDADDWETTLGYSRNGWITNVTLAGTSQQTRYDAEGIVRERISAMGHTRTYHTDKIGFVTSIVDELGYTSTLQRDSVGRIVQAENAQGHSHVYTYDGAGRIVGATRPGGGGMTITRNPLGLPVRVTGYDGEIYTYGYSPMGRVVAVTNPVGDSVRLTRDTRGRVSRMDKADGSHVEYTYDGLGRVTIFRDEATNDWRVSYNYRGQVLARTNPAGGYARFTYRQDGRLDSWTESGLGIYSNSYNSARLLSTAYDPMGYTKQFEYDAFQRVTNAVDENGHRHARSYNADGWLIHQTFPDTTTVQYAYDAAGHQTNRTDRLGNTTTYEYDPLGRRIRTVSAEGVAVTGAYDAANRLVSLTQNGQTRSRTYDGRNNVCTSIDPSGYISKFSRDPMGVVTQLTDEAGQINIVSRDAMQRVTGFVDACGRTNRFSYNERGLLRSSANELSRAEYSYDLLGHLDTLTDPMNQDWKFDHDAVGRLTRLRDPLLRETTYTYNEVGRVATIVQPNLKTITNEYDAAGMLTNRVCSDGTEVRYSYDSLNRIVDSYSISFVRDAEGRVISTEDGGIAFGATYDKDGRPKTITYNNGAFTVTYNYDPVNGILTNMNDDLTGTSIEFTYDANGRPATIVRPNGVDTAYTWDPVGRITRLQHGSIIDLAADLDPAGLVTRETRTVPLGAAEAVSSGSLQDTFDNAAQLSGAGYQYDSCGRLTNTPAYSVTWNGLSRLTDINDVELFYNGMGDLVVRAEDNATNHFFYNYAWPEKPIMAERDDTTGLFVRYYVRNASGALLYMIDAADGNKVYHYHFDRSGSTLALTDAGGAVADAYAYTPYGRLLGHTGTSDQPFTFIGQFGVRREGTNNIYHMQARYYDAESGRFLSRDPVWPEVVDVRVINPYQYALSNPLKYIDALGTFFQEAQFMLTVMGGSSPLKTFVVAHLYAGAQTGRLPSILLPSVFFEMLPEGFTFEQGLWLYWMMMNHPNQFYEGMAWFLALNTPVPSDPRIEYTPSDFVIEMQRLGRFLGYIKKEPSAGAMTYTLTDEEINEQYGLKSPPKPGRIEYTLSDEEIKERNGSSSGGAQSGSLCTLDDAINELDDAIQSLPEQPGGGGGGGAMNFPTIVCPSAAFSDMAGSSPSPSDVCRAIKKKLILYLWRKAGGNVAAFKDLIDQLGVPWDPNMLPDEVRDALIDSIKSFGARYYDGAWTPGYDDVDADDAKNLLGLTNDEFMTYTKEGWEEYAKGETKAAAADEEKRAEEKAEEDEELKAILDKLSPEDREGLEAIAKYMGGLGKQ